MYEFNCLLVRGTADSSFLSSSGCKLAVGEWGETLFPSPGLPSLCSGVPMSHAEAEKLHLGILQGLLPVTFPLREEELWFHPGSLSPWVVTEQSPKPAILSYECPIVRLWTIWSFFFCLPHLCNLALLTFRISEQSSLGNTVSAGMSNWQDAFLKK